MILQKNKPNLNYIELYQNTLDNSKNDSSLLGNREIGKRVSQIYKKYYKKQIAQNALTVGNTEDFIKSKKSEYNSKKNRGIKKTLSFAMTLKTINKTLCSCGRDPHYMNESGNVELKKSDTGTYKLKGLKSCGNNSACPVCASKLSFSRGNDLAKLIEDGKKNNRSYAMIVTTIPHKPLEKLEVTLNQVIDMSRYIFNSTQWKKFRKVTQCQFAHGGLENMVSFKNGRIDWHPHKNYLLDFAIPLEDVFASLGLKTDLEFRLYLSKMLTSIGQRFLKNEKINKKLMPVRLFETKETLTQVKGGVTCSTHFDDKYITKWGLDAEMTGGIYKEGRYEGGSFHPFGLLDMIDQENKEIGDKQRYQAIMAFQEFVVASRGKHWFYFGKGAIKYYNENYGSKIRVKSDKEALESLNDEGSLLRIFSGIEWNDFRYTPRKVYNAFTRASDSEVLQYFIDEIERNKDFWDFEIAPVEIDPFDFDMYSTEYFRVATNYKE